MDAVANETKLSQSCTIRVTNGGGEGKGARGKKGKTVYLNVGADQARNGNEGLRLHA
ncbi:hypothetical protein X777_04777 [Ooceraea biroi]|uniref:Uncharacterized protein n=1 Tax=Ooceraea biroi TaxID=2015173 RepID=A0A026WJM7_OOCBI|nr:hypothetical protein X777_04777 [Ooceraea biroi]